MPTDRTESLPAIWAENAEELPISGSPAVGTTYRKEALDAPTVQAGWPFATINNSAEFNEVMRTLTSLMRQLEQWGMLPWCATTIYAADARVMGSDGKLYRALQATTGNDPTVSSTHWTDDTVGTHAALTAPHSATAEAIPSRLVVRDNNGRFKAAAPASATDVAIKATVDTVQTNLTTHQSLSNPHNATSAATPGRIMLRDTGGRVEVVGGVSGNQAVNFAQFEKSLVTSGYQKLPGGLIVQWFKGPVAGVETVSYPALTFPVPFPNACLMAFASTQGNDTIYSDQIFQISSYNKDNVKLFPQWFGTGTHGGLCYPLVFAIGY